MFSKGGNLPSPPFQSVTLLQHKHILQPNNDRESQQKQSTNLNKEHGNNSYSSDKFSNVEKLGGKGPSKEVPCISLRLNANHHLIQTNNLTKQALLLVIVMNHSQVLDLCPIGNEAGNFSRDRVAINSAGKTRKKSLII